ncbi:Aerobic glycerol-3-phosphate dehydrogenase [Planctomycetes bacterium Pla163]|uniref:Glycerol-3-phosphate dehydrogenase n=1 Tax=Rohdeia mirabilis TaxID=2528008 RepID=A0A518D4G7_9BACT|nr:Aerobic glycerol-3-phosphate dehydrogenase [Planctomycetes bacterium Pla163]
MARVNADAPTPPPARARRLQRLASGERFDVLVVGGGVTGAGVALDLTCRGLKVALVERADWGQETSSASSRLLHGGLRYLETYEFGLVRESCLERSLLLRNAAGLAWPERFTFPLFRGGRVGRLKLAAGLGLYTALSVPRVLGIPGLVGVKDTQRAIPGIASGVIGAGQYLDGATDDARLVWSVVRTAIERGALCASRVAVTAIEQDGSGVEARLVDRLGASGPDADAPELGRLRADHAVLCGGPFTEQLRALAGLSGTWLSPTRGTHVVLPRHRLPTDGAVVFASPVDGRVMFVLPWPGHTIVGTTDVDAPVERRGNHERGEASDAEVEYLLASANGLVPGAALVRADVISVWSGLRPLLAAPKEDPSARSREERVERDGAITTIAGGKLTGFRSMAEKLGAQLVRHLERDGGPRADTGPNAPRLDGRRASPTRDLRLWGALDARVARPAWSSAEPDAAGLRDAALAGRYGRFAAAARRTAAEGPHAGREALDPQTTWADVAWAAEYEDALEPADVFVRRTDLGYTRPDVAGLAADEVASILAGRRSE